MMSVVRAMEEDASSQGPGCISHYATPVEDTFDNIGMKAWGAHAYKLRGMSPRFEELSAWYEALRLLVVSWERAEDAAIVFLRMSCYNSWLEEWGPQVHDVLYAFWAAVPESFPRFERLKAALRQKNATVANFRGIIFVQQRVITHILQYVIESDAELRALFQPTCIYA